jgi:hypothetical protein
MLEWFIAFILLFKYGKMIQRPDIQRFAILMIPHWLGGMCVILFHITGDQVAFLLDLSKIINFFGSMALISGAILIIRYIKSTRVHEPVVTASTFLGLGWLHLTDYQTFIESVFQLSSMFYLVFLVLILYIYRLDKQVFSKLTVFGFWFVLIFVAVTVVTIYYSTQIRGFETLTHDDFYHGFAESFLSLSNLMIAIGINNKIKLHQRSFEAKESNVL